MVTVFGIRHHGPGSGKNLLRALREWQPDCLLIEAPADAEGAIPLAGHPDLLPPVALLIYNPKELKQAVYLPFAEFSPEWLAIRYGLDRDLPIRLMDLPMGMAFTLAKEEEEKPELALSTEVADEEELRLRYDPLGFLAQLAGYTDSERWWEQTFEQYDSEAAIFEAILSLMTALREERNWEKPETLRREAYMRKVLRKAIKDGFQRIAVVCGAWHAPALHHLDQYKQSGDNQLLRGIRKTKTAYTWIPWSYDRLALHSGYGAGVVSPAWYELLFRHREEVAVRWMAKVARLFRSEDLDASSAHALEAVRLANTLATLRQRPVPGIDELQEAAVAIFCDGDETPLALIRRRLVIGDVIGMVPSDIPQLPLQSDLESTIKSARLSKEYRTTEPVDKKLDLRKDTNLLASHLLHRLNLLHIPWGQVQEGSQYQLGSFTELWRLHWRPDFAIGIIEAGMLGNTVEAAATAAARRKAAKEEHLPGLTHLMEEVLHADLGAVVSDLVTRLQETAALSRDVMQLMAALPPLVRILRYGNTRQTDTQAVAHLVDEIIPRIGVGLPGACLGVEEEPARELFAMINQVNHAVALLNDPDHQRDWLQALEQAARLEQASELISGLCVRLLFDKNAISVEETGRRLQFNLSRAQSPAAAALWLEGFLHGSGLLLIHTPVLWQLIDDWVNTLTDEIFEETLPLLRRTFANFSAPERQKMLVMAKTPFAAVEKDEELAFDGNRTEMVLPLLRKLLDLPN